MTVDSTLLGGGELNAAITSAVVGVHHRHLGRGPKSATTFYKDNVVVTLMHEVMTHAERSLAENAQGDAVTNMRHLLQLTMEADFVTAIEGLTGRRVIAFISGNSVDPDIASELFILDRDL